MTQSDPTDDALAAIASILDHGEAHRGPGKAASGEHASPLVMPAQADGYRKSGPGPMEAVRSRWTVRRGENDAYFVDETIGENSTPRVMGPMTRDAAIKLVDDQESDARSRFEQIRNEIIGRSATFNMARSVGDV
ncbi:MAG: hypothetical protein ACREDC_11825 [Bradyrhizobium sp.]